jgi:hypothetical protein
MNMSGHGTACMLFIILENRGVFVRLSKHQSIVALVVMSFVAVTTTWSLGFQIPAIIDSKCYNEFCNVGWVSGTYTCTAEGVGTCTVCDSVQQKETCYTELTKCCKRAGLAPHDCGNKMQGSCVVVGGNLTCLDLLGIPLGGRCSIASCSVQLGDDCPGGGAGT